MDREEIIRMARGAGIYHEYDSEGHWDGLTNEALIGKDWLSSKEHKLDRIVEILFPFAVLVAAAEREACANLLLNVDLSSMDADHRLQSWTATVLLNFSAAIRARGER